MGTATETIEAQAKKTRDRRAEAVSAQLSFFENIVDLRKKREDGDLDDKWQIAQALILCSLPYDEVTDTHWVRSARLGDASNLRVTFAATEKGVPLPFGQDRGPLYYIMNKAIIRYRQLLRQVNADPQYALDESLDEEELTRRKLEREEILDKARFVEWTTATEYNNLMRKKGGWSRENLSARIERLRHCAISIVRETSYGEETLLLPLMHSTRTPNWARTKRNKAAHSTALEKSPNPNAYGFEIGRDVFRDYVRFHVPVPVEIIIALLRRPRILDLFVWLCWRVYAAKTDAFIPLTEIQQQIGSADTNQRRVLQALREAIQIARGMGWTELRAEVLTRRKGKKFRGVQMAGLQVGPPRKGVQFCHSVAKTVEVDPLPEDVAEVRQIIQDSFKRRKI